MACSLTCTIYVALGCIVAAVGFQLGGFFTNYWFTGTSDSQGADIVKISVGLWKQKLEYRNGTITNTDSVLNIREEHYIMLAEAVGNFLLCFVVLFKNIHVCVGIIAFVNMTLLLLSAFYSFVHLEDAREDLQKVFAEWPELVISWSFYFVWLGILINIVATGAFLTALLIKGEIKATKSSKGLGPVHKVVHGDIEEEKVVRISTVSGDNYGYRDERDKKATHISDSGASYPGSSHEPVEQIADIPKTNVDIAKASVDSAKVNVDNAKTEGGNIDDNTVKSEDVNVPNNEQTEATEPYYIGRVNADDAENLEFGYEHEGSELADIIDQIGNETRARDVDNEDVIDHDPLPTQDENVIETSRL